MQQKLIEGFRRGWEQGESEVQERKKTRTFSEKLDVANTHVTRITPIIAPIAAVAKKTRHAIGSD